MLHSELGAALGVERFQREIRTQARLQHPHILPLFDSGSAAGRLFCTMPYVEGGSLRDRLRREGPLPVEAAAQLVAEVASALTYAHALGVIHRDIKPANILISASGHALLTDFGIAYAIEDGGGRDRAERITESGVTLGTPAYMSPEQSVGDETVDSRSDIYSLAVVVYEMLAGAPPFTGPNPRAIMARRLTSSAAPARGRPAGASAGGGGGDHRAPSPASRPTGSRPPPNSPSRCAAAARSRHRTPEEPGPPDRRPWRRYVAAAALAILLLVGAVLGAHRALRRDRGAAAHRASGCWSCCRSGTSGDSADAYFADGLTEELTSRLASLGGLRVISRTSAEQYRASTRPLKADRRRAGRGVRARRKRAPRPRRGWREPRAGAPQAHLRRERQPALERALRGGADRGLPGPVGHRRAGDAARSTSRCARRSARRSPRPAPAIPWPTTSICGGTTTSAGATSTRT